MKLPFGWGFAISMVLIGGSMLLRPQSALAYHTGMAASTVLGQSNFTSNFQNVPHLDSGFSNPQDIATDGTHLFVVDGAGSRVLIYNHIPTSSGAKPDVVVGQPDMNSVQPNQGGTANAHTLNYPMGVAVAGNKLIIADTQNYRVLIYNTIPTVNNAAADVVIGQPDMTSTNYGVSSTQFSNPEYVAYDATSGKLAISDNFRILLYNSLPMSNGAAANVVVGQADFTTNAANHGGSVSAKGFWYFAHAYIFTNQLVVVDSLNQRVLVYNTIPTSNDVAADVVIGQTDMTSHGVNAGGIGAASLYYPWSTAFDGTNLAIEDRFNNRVLIFSGIPTVNHASASSVLGQPNFTSSSYGTSSTSLSDPSSGATFANGKLLVGERGNNRISVFSSLATNAAADLVIGQTGFSGNQPFAGTIDASHFNRPAAVATDGTHFFVADTSNNRVLVYSSMPSQGTVPDAVIGQPDFTSSAANQGGSAAANTLNQPRGIAFDGTRLVVADWGNKRILIYNHIPTNNNAAADVVIGQTGFTSTTTGVSATQFGSNGPSGISYDKASDILAVTDDSNSRVLLYHGIPTSNGAAASVVVGQTNFTTGTVCATPGPATLCNEGTPRILGGKLVVPDEYNNRVLIWNNIPTTNGASADVVVGQPDFSSTTANQGLASPTAKTLSDPSDVAYDGHRFFVSDPDNNRILLFNGIPTSNGQAATRVIGQTSLTNGDYASPSATSFTIGYYNVFALATNRLVVNDSFNNRILYFDNPVPTASSSAATFTNNLKPSVSWTFADGDPGDTQSAYQVQFDTSSQFNSPNLVDSGSVSGAASGFSPPSNLADGQWYARVRLTDSQGDTGDWGQVLGMMVDTIAPDKATPIYPMVGQTVPGKFTFGWEASDSGSGVDHYALYVDGQLWNGSLTSPSFALTDALVDGSHSYMVKTFDKAGNSSTSDTFSFTVDSTAPPQVTIISVGTVMMHGAHSVYYTGHRPTFKGLAEPGSTVHLEIHSDPIELTATTGANGIWSVTPTQDIPNGDHTVTITATDSAGNVSQPLVLGLHINTGLAATGTPLWPFSLIGLFGTVVTRRELRKRNKVSFVSRPRATHHKI